MLISRSDRGVLARWWFTVDWLLMSAVLVLMSIGILVSMAASPPVAERIGLDNLHFVRSQVFYIGIAAPLMIFVSMFSLTWLKRFAVVGAIGSLFLMILALQFGPEIKGAHRWIEIAGVGLQPSEFMKPFFVVVAAWFLSDSMRRPDMPSKYIAYGLAMVTLLVLILQPDLGQVVLFATTFGALLMISGLPWVFVLSLSVLAVAGLGLAYVFLPHVTSRFDRFLAPDKGDTFQVDTALEAFRNGGLIGTGPGGGAAKLVLPDAHTDFAFAVVAEEFGLVACLCILALIAFIVLRVLIRARAEPQPFRAAGLTGLATLFGLQAVINMGVNTALLPAKGMTLPLVSYGGSSLLGMALLTGFILGLSRKHNHEAGDDVHPVRFAVPVVA